MIKMIISDLDGTILHHDFTCTKKTIQTIKRATKKGIIFLPATGRPFQDIQEIFHRKGICCDAICVNGALACDAAGTVLARKQISKDTVELCIRILESYGFHIQIFSDKDVFAYKDAKGVAMDIHQVVSRNMGKVFPYQENEVIDEHLLHQYPILKLETMSLDDARLNLCKQELMKLEGIDVTSSVYGNIEITHRDSTKGKMLEHLLSHYQVRRDEVLIFGDSLNDASLFLNFPNTVAVANANDYIKEHAKELCASCEADGVAEYIEGMLCM